MESEWTKGAAERVSARFMGRWGHIPFRSVYIKKSPRRFFRGGFLSNDYFLKVRGRMLAQRTDKVRRKFLPLVDISANRTAPGGFPGRSLPARFGLDVGLVICVGRRRVVGKHFHIIHGSDKQHVAAQIHGLLHRGADTGVGPGGNDIESVGAAPAILITSELIHIPTGLESEMAEDIETGRLTEYGEIEPAALSHHFLGEIRLVYRDTDPIGLACHLNACVDNTPVILSLKGGGKNEQSVAQLVHRFIIHGNSSSNYVALREGGIFVRFPPANCNGIILKCVRILVKALARICQKRYNEFITVHRRR